MNVKKMSEEGAVTTINEICDGLKDYINANHHIAKYILTELTDLLDNLSSDDCFGTEGWEHAFGIEV